MKLLLIILSLTISLAMPAQKSTKLFGTWEGKINVGISLRLVFNFTKDSAGNITGTAYSPDQGNKEIPCSDIYIQNDSIFLGIQSLKVSYAGKFINDSTIKGKLTQGQTVDLTLQKVLQATKLSRPQSPHPPYPYLNEDVEFDNPDKTLHYGATLTIPKGKGPFAAMILITGSGAQNRDEEIFEHKPFAVIADYLTRQGFMIMRVDDRGIGTSSGDFSKATTADFVTDVSTSLNYLKNRKEVDLKRLGILGHSEGGMIAPMVASQRNDINFIILLAAPGEKISTLMEKQNVDILKSAGVSNEAAEDYGKLYHNMVSVFLEAKTTGEAETNLAGVVNEWKKNTPKDIVIATTGIMNDTTQQNFIKGLSATLNSPWYKYFLQFDPRPYLTKLNCKVLALNGEKDLQVSSKDNLAAINTALKKSNSPSYEVKEMPGLNHLFQDCNKCTLNEYSELEETFSPRALHIISEWLNKTLK